MFYYVVPFNLEQDKLVECFVSEMCHFAGSFMLQTPGVRESHLTHITLITAVIEREYCPLLDTSGHD